MCCTVSAGASPCTFCCCFTITGKQMHKLAEPSLSGRKFDSSQSSPSLAAVCPHQFINLLQKAQISLGIGMLSIAKTVFFLKLKIAAYLHKNFQCKSVKCLLCPEKKS